jgi:hypothetical protein
MIDICPYQRGCSSEKSREIIEHMYIIPKRLFVRKIKGDI